MALVKCPECNKEVSDQAESCVGCGYPFAVNKCYECGKVVGENDEICSNCGAPLVESEDDDPDIEIINGVPVNMREMVEVCNGDWHLMYKHLNKAARPSDWRDVDVQNFIETIVGATRGAWLKYGESVVPNFEQEKAKMEDLWQKQDERMAKKKANKAKTEKAYTIVAAVIIGIACIVIITILILYG